jgi:hypothetical protein
MRAAELVRMLQDQSRPMLEGLFGELRTNLGTSHYHRLSNEELFRRGNAVLAQLVDWLTARDAAAVHRFSVELGRERFHEGIPLGQVVLSFILGEKQIWSYAGQLGQQPDEPIRLEVAEFFARMIYSTALGYEEALSESQRKSRGTITTPSKAAAAAEQELQEDLPISRSGEIGEHGG